MDKRWLSHEEQVELLQERGLSVADIASATEFLSRVNYYRLSGYFRYWQIDPAAGNNRFLDDSSFEVIQRLYESEQNLVAVCDEVLHPIEVLLVTRFGILHRVLPVRLIDGKFTVNQDMKVLHNGAGHHVTHWHPNSAPNRPLATTQNTENP